MSKKNGYESINSPGKRPLFLSIFVIVTLFCVVAVSLTYSRRDPIAELHSDPNQARPWEHGQQFWEDIHTVDPSADPFDARYDMGYSVTSLDETAPGEWEGRVHVENPDPDPYDGDYELLRMDSHVLIDGKPVRFEMTGQSVFSRETFIGEFDRDDDYYRFGLDLYRPDGNPFDPERLRQWFEADQIHYLGQTVLNRGRFYGFSFLLSFPEDEAVKVGPRYIFDPRTRALINGGFGSRSKPNAQYFNTQLPLLTGEKVLISQDLFHGPVKTSVLTAPRMGDGISGESFRAQLVFMGSGQPGHYGHNSSRGDRNVRFGGIRKRDSHAHFAFVFTPPNAHYRTEILAVDAGGNTAPLRHRSSSHGEVVLEVEMSMENIRELRFHYRTGAKRLLVEVPLFAVPPENREVDDLFDARIPLVVIRNEQHWRSTVADLVQLRHWISSFQERIPEATFPLVFENITVRDLLAEYHRLRPDVDIRVDHAEMNLVFDDASGNRLWKKFKTWFRRATRHPVP